MGLTYSRVNHKVTKVAPVKTKEKNDSPCFSDSEFNGRLERRHACSLDSPAQCNTTLEKQLPPLRETLHAVPRPISFDITMEHEETSIIKRHPPRRPQKLEPIDLPTILTSEKLLSKPVQTQKELENRVQIAKHTAGRRQHLHKMQMLEINRKRQEMNHLQSQAEMKRNHHREAWINKQKRRDLKANKIRENSQRNNDEEEFITVEHDETNVHHGNLWNGDTSEQCDTPEFYRSKNSKLELWLKKHQAGKEILCDSSSDESLDCWKGEDKKIHHRPPLLRTKNEIIPNFDEFFD